MDEANHLAHIAVELQDDDRTLVVRGVVDLAAVPSIERALDGLDGDVLLDLSDVPFMDSSGLALLLDRSERARAGGRRLAIRTSPAVRAVVDLARVADELDLDDAG